MIEELKALKELLDMGAITQEEFDRKKSDLLNTPGNSTAEQAPPQQNACVIATAVPTKQTTSNTQAAVQTRSPKDKTAAGLLAIFLGWLGVHKFYLGYTTEGITMLLISLLGSPALGIFAGLLFGILAAFLAYLPIAAMIIISFIEGIVYLTRTNEAFETTYVQGRKGWF